jgi:hypothetical protein
MFTAPLSGNRIPIFRRVSFCGNGFSDQLISNVHGTDQIENTSCNTIPIVACAYFGRCLEMGLLVTLQTSFYNPAGAKMNDP